MRMEFYTEMTLHWSSLAGRNLGIGKCCCKVFTGLLVTWMSCSLRILVRGSVMPLMQGRTAKLRRFVGSAHLKNIPTNSSGVGIKVVEASFSSL